MYAIRSYYVTSLHLKISRIIPTASAAGTVAKNTAWAVLTLRQETSQYRLSLILPGKERPMSFQPYTSPVTMKLQRLFIWAIL